MNSKQLLKFCLENGLLVDKEVLSLFDEAGDIDSAKLIIKSIKNYTSHNIITKSVFYENKDKFNELFCNLPKGSQEELEKIKIKLGLSIEISKEKSIDFQGYPNDAIIPKREDFSKNKESQNSVEILSPFPDINKKLEVQDFVNYFRGRFSEFKPILQSHSELDNLISIGKIFGNRHKISIIGIISNKSFTKNRNIILEVEDNTGKLKIIVNKDKKELFEKAENLALDSVIGFKGSGNEERFFAEEIVYPDSSLPERKFSKVDESVAFIGDLHFGSKRFMEDNFLRFIDYLNGDLGDEEDSRKIKYLFLAGDLITGIGNYPDQEKDLEIFDLEEQFIGLAGILSKIRKDIKIIISPGNHDGVRLMEPQPTLDQKYAWPLYELSNVYMTQNPGHVSIGKRDDFSGFSVLTYHGFSYPYYANNIPYLIKKRAMNCPEEIMKYLLKNRHLAPSHTSTQYFPYEKDGLLISEIPDIFVSAHTHKCGVAYYNNILIVSTSCWEEMTPYQEKFGNTPDHCKVPIFNLKTRKIKILDFEEKEESKPNQENVIQENKIK